MIKKSGKYIVSTFERYRIYGILPYIERSLFFYGKFENNRSERDFR